MRLRVAIFLVVVCLSAVVFSCRRNQPSLVDANRPPETELWYSPPDSSEYDYLVHMYWRGVDTDGVAVRYIWTITDTLMPTALDWDPSTRVRDFRSGRITTRTDSVFSFTAFRNVSGVGVKKNRQAFHIAAIDDNGVIDPSPARIEFVATVQTLPLLRFITESPGRPQSIYDPDAVDTVGMYRPFRISYRGSTTNGMLRGYRFFPLTTGVELEGAGDWTDDLTDTLRVFPNRDEDALPSGDFLLAAQCRDDAGAESVVDASRFRQGVARMVVNFEPDTRIFHILNTYFKGTQAFKDTVNFGPGVPPDTVPFGSWLFLQYEGWDNQADSMRCALEFDKEPIDVTQKCIKYQVNYTRVGEQRGGPSEGGTLVSSTVRWLPDEPDNRNPGAVWDSTSMNVGSEKYTVRVRSVDEYEKRDGTPAEATIIGNFKPTLDTYAVQNYDGTIVGPGDTLAWDWWNPANVNDTIRIDPANPGDIEIVKYFYFVVRGTGHDNAKELIGHGVKSWFYIFRRSDDPSIIQKFAHSGAWTDGMVTNTFSDTFKLFIRYDWLLGGVPADPGGVEARTLLPKYLNKGYKFSLRGRDLSSVQRFDQKIWLDGVLVTQNSFNTSTLGRYTSQGIYDLFFEMRD